ncbi:MAG: hypothetical protein JWR26_535 [Pedosphaera sp.]|nr:hypothetical protein [Pedosphaera sp.]
MKPLTLYLLIIVLVLFQLSCRSKPVPATMDDDGLANMLNHLKPWPAFRGSETYSKEDWLQVELAARRLQKCDKTSVQETLARWKNNENPWLRYNTELSSELYLVMRVMFELPEHAPESDFFGFGGWLCLPPGASLYNEDGTMNLCWPVSWKSGEPHLIAGCRGLHGPAYEPAAEYHYLHDHYRFRDLSSVKQ